jgi:hypothetical protein
MKTTVPARSRAKLLASVVALAAIVGLAGCSKSDSKSTDVKTTTTDAATSVAAGTDEGAGALKATLVGEMMKSMNNGAPADQKDIDCVSKKVTDPQVSALMASAAGGGGMSKDAVPVLKAMFSCKPKALTESFIASSFTDMPADVTADQKTCMANKFFDFIASNDEIMSSIVADASKPPAAFKTEGAKIVKECVPAGASQDKLIAEIQKDS